LSNIERPSRRGQNLYETYEPWGSTKRHLFSFKKALDVVVAVNVTGMSQWSKRRSSCSKFNSFGERTQLGVWEGGREGEGELYEELLHTGGESRAVATKASTINGPRVKFELPTFLPLF
jgi:hypothetical protein